MIYQVFGGEIYYPRGGMEDCLASYGELDEALAFAKGYIHPQGESLRWAQVAHQGKVVWDSRQ